MHVNCSFHLISVATNTAILPCCRVRSSYAAANQNTTYLNNNNSGNVMSLDNRGKDGVRGGGGGICTVHVTGMSWSTFDLQRIVKHEFAAHPHLPALTTRIGRPAIVVSLIQYGVGGVHLYMVGDVKDPRLHVLPLAVSTTPEVPGPVLVWNDTV